MIINLLIAHGWCNSRRGVRLVEDARFELAGTMRAPLSDGEQVAGAVVVGSIAGLAAGHIFAQPTPDGGRRFNGSAAAGAGLLLALLFLATS